MDKCIIIKGKTEKRQVLVKRSGIKEPSFETCFYLADMWFWFSEKPLYMKRDIILQLTSTFKLNVPWGKFLWIVTDSSTQ